MLARVQLRCRQITDAAVAVLAARCGARLTEARLDNGRAPRYWCARYTTNGHHIVQKCNPSPGANSLRAEGNVSHRTTSRAAKATRFITELEAASGERARRAPGGR